MKTLEKIDQFYIILTVTLVTLAVLVLLTIKTIFASFTTSRNVETENITAIDSNAVINEGNLTKAIQDVYQKEYQPLDLK